MGTDYKDLLDRFVVWFRQPPLLVRQYTVKYPVSFGCMTINEAEYKCFACCKYHAYLQFIKATKDNLNHYSARENRTPLTYDVWKDDISA